MTTQTIVRTIREQAELLAHENQTSDPDVEKVFWFEHDSEVHLVETHLSVPPTDDDDKNIYPFYFQASPENGLPWPSGIALIQPEEFGKLDLPADWNKEWSDAIQLLPKPAEGEV